MASGALDEADTHGDVEVVAVEGLGPVLGFRTRQHVRL